MRAHHVLLFVESLAGGGVERVALRLAGAWIRAGRRVSIVIGSLDGPLVAEIPAGIDLHVLGRGDYGALCAGTVRAIGTLAPDLIFCPGNYYSAIAVAAKIALGERCPPIICKISNAFDRSDFNAFQQYCYAFWLRFHARFIDRFVALSDGMRAEARFVAKLRRDAIVTIPNPAAPPRPMGEFAPVGAPLILGVGRLAPQKRFPRLVEAFARLPRSLGARLVIAGEGPERGAILAAARRFGVAGRVGLPGNVADPVTLMAQARVVALASHYEGMPNVLVEALSVGTPVVATECSSAIPDIVTDPRLGSIVAIDDVAAMADALERQLARPADRAAIRGLAAQRRVPDSPALWLVHMDALVAERVRARGGRFFPARA